jgi:hypothetical protein
VLTHHPGMTDLAPVNPAVTSFVYASPTIKPREYPGLGISERRFMLRFKILASAVPLILAALFARGGLWPGSHPCIAGADTSMEISDLPWHADLHVAFTDDPATATVRVQVSDNAEAADFAVVDDAEAAEPGACAAGPATRFVTVSASPAGGTPVIYLSQDGPADYRIFVRSKRFSVRDAAALVVGAGGGHPQQQDASLSPLS